MSRASRGGLTLKPGKIGRANILRQQLLMPGEMMNVNISGQVRLESLRERDVMRVNAHLAAFATPLRWVVPNYSDYLREGPDTLETIATVSNEASWDRIGIGSYQTTAPGQYHQFWEDVPILIANRWYKWPEDPDISGIHNDGFKTVPLSAAWTRCRYDATPDDSGDYTVASTTSFDVRDLAEIQARFRDAMKRDVMSFNRWQELISQVYRGDGSREVDKVPIMLDQVDVGVNPRELPASDGPSLGQWQSLYDFGVNHTINGILAPEHMVVTYILTVRFAAITESIHPLAAANRLDWHEFTANPEMLSAGQPVEVQKRDLFQSNSSNSFGYLPKGWQWRCDHNVIGKRVDERNSFPMMNVPDVQAECKDATRIKDAFRSQSLGDYLVDVYFKEECRQPIGDSMDSYFSGMLDEATPGMGGRNDEFPYGGKNL